MCVVKYTPQLHLIPEELDKSATRMVKRARRVVFIKHAWNPGASTSSTLCHHRHTPRAPLLNYMRDHGLPIAIPQGMNKSDMEKTLQYSLHYSAIKDNNFLRKELADKIHADHMNIFTWEAVKHLPGLWLSPLDSAPQAGRQQRLIYNLSWSGLNEKADQAAPK